MNIISRHSCEVLFNCIQDYIPRPLPNLETTAALPILAYFRGHIGRKERKKAKKEIGS